VSNDEIIILGEQPGEFCYEFSAVNACGSTSDTVIVYVVPEQRIDAQPDTVITACAPVDMEICLTATGVGFPEDCIEWTDLDGNVLGTGSELCVMPPVGVSQYIATAPMLDCVSPDTVTVQVDTELPPDLPGLPDTLKLCIGDTDTLSIQDYDQPFVWTDENGNTVSANGPLVVTGEAAGTEAFILTATNGCGSVSDTVRVITVEPGLIQIMPEDTIVCSADPITLTADAVLPDCVVWVDSNGMPLDTGATLTIIPEPGANVYTASIPGLDCIVSDTTVITYLPDELVVEVAVSEDTICLGATVTLTAEITPDTTAAMVSWFDGDDNLLGTGHSIEVEPLLEGTATYVVMVENICGALAMDSVEVFAESLDLALVGGDTTICSGDPPITLEVIGCEDCTYAWTPEESLSDPDQPITLASPLESTTYQVVVAGQACVDTLSTGVNVENCLDCECDVDMIFVADAFTPNGDSNNDLVCVRSEILDQFIEIEFMIYNRWGQEVFYSSDPQNLCWDGVFDGEALAPDVYGYHLRVVCSCEEQEDEVYDLKGNITLLR
jgi:gliding motility-associated-like protein